MMKSDMKAYFDDLKRRPVMTREELLSTYDAVETAHAEDKKRLINKIVVGNLRLVVAEARRHFRPGMPINDMIQEGNVGLIRAAEKFDHKRGFMFSTYARWWIKQALLQFSGVKHKAMRVPTHAVDIAKRVRAAIEDASNNGWNPDVSDVATALGINEDVAKAAVFAYQSAISLESSGKLNDNNSSGNILSKIPSGDPDPEEMTSSIELSGVLKSALSSLYERESAVLKMRYALESIDARDENEAR